MLFSEYDLRGILGKDLSLEIIYKIIKIFFKETRAKKILVASDFNKNNLKIKNFLKDNFEVEDLGILPTPIFYFQVIKRKIPGIMITASHLPLKYSGLKFILKDGTSWKVKLANLRELKRKLMRTSKYSSYKFAKSSYWFAENVYEDYFQKLKSIVKPKKKIFVEFDLKNFFLKTSLPYFRKLNIFHKKNSLIKIKSDFDNDRIYLYYKNKQILADLIFYFLASQKQYKFLGCPIFFSQKLRKLLLQKNKKIYFIRTGHNYFKQAYKKFKIDLAFEPSGHFYLFKDLKTEAPYLAVSLFLHKLNNFDNLLETFKLNLYRFDIIVPMKKVSSLENFALFLKKQFRLKLKKFDGYLLWQKGFYLHFRPSQTENKIRLSFEGDKKYLLTIKKWFKKL